MNSSNYSLESEMKKMSLHNDVSNLAVHHGGDEDDDRPLSYHQQQGLNSAQQANDIRIVYDNYLQKIYYEGQIWLNQQDNWTPWYFQLLGPTLILWEDTSKAPYASYDIIDAVIRFLGRSNTDSGHNNLFSIALAHENLMLDAPDYQSLLSWIAAFRLSCFEWAKIQECYTRRILLSQQGDIKTNISTHLEGSFQVQLDPLKDTWNTCWVVVSARAESNVSAEKEEKKKSKLKLFGGGKKKKTDKKELLGRGQLFIYESSNKSTKPLLTLVNAVQAYALYNAPNVFKVEGNIIGQNHTNSIIIKTNSPKELTQWMMSTLDIFKLYGRPSRLNDDPFNINSLNFGELPGTNSLISLELADVLGQLNPDFVNETLLDTKAQFTSYLLHKLQQRQQYRPQQPMGLIHQIPTGAQVTSSSNHSSRPPSQRTSVYSSQSSSINTPTNRPQAQQKRLSHTPITTTASGRQVYASDDSSSEEEEEQESESDDDSDHDSVFNNKPAKVKMDNAATATAASAAAEGFQQQPPVAIPTTNKKEVNKKGEDSEDEFGLSSDNSSGIKKPITTANHNRPKPKISRTQVSISDSEEDEEEDKHNHIYESDDDNMPIQQQRQLDVSYYDYQQGLPWDSASMMMEQQQHQQAYYDYDEDGPVIPQLGDRFATQNSLLDTYRPDRASAHDQEGFARATGQPLIQVPNKPPEPRAGLIGMISQIENEKKQKEANKHLMNSRERMMMMERERYLMDQRTQQQQSMMQPAMGMMNPGMNMMNPGMNVMNPGMNMMNPMMYSNMMPMMPNQMPLMQGQMPMTMNPMMYPGMMQQPYPGMMPNMMDPRFMMMQQQQQQLWQQQSMYSNSRFNASQNHILEEDEDDDIPLGAAKDTHSTAIPTSRHK
ncbi:MAG: hypothetical protein EXX96DRAFT_251706 [Benjaminiella poitrasii]|nr:MAG: hypothetical protein EXX96DRAFT_251706 [Benjaminiella poitrasii]